MLNKEVSYASKVGYRVDKKSASQVRKPIGVDAIPQKKIELSGRRLHTRDGREVGNCKCLGHEKDELIKVAEDGGKIKFFSYEEIINMFYILYKIIGKWNPKT